MKIVFYSAHKAREIMLAEALKLGARAHGDDLEIRHTGDYGETDEGDDRKFPGPTPDTDVACVFGVKGRSRQVLDDHRLVGKPTLFLDKGYSRSKGEGGHTEYSRISVNADSPVKYMMNRKFSDDRWKKLGVKLSPRIKNVSGHILLCGSSLKYHTFHKLEEPDEYYAKLVKRLVKLSSRQIIYRPKPSYKGSHGVAGTCMSTGAQTIVQALRGAHVTVTHGSAAAMDSIIAGISTIVLGPGIALPVAEQILENVEHPAWAKDEERQRWANAMAYCQWTTTELRTGEAWAHLKEEITRQANAVRVLPS